MIEESFTLFEPDADVPEFIAARNREMVGYWTSLLRGRRMPRRADFDPGAVRAMLPHIMLTEIIGSEPRIRYRLVGTAIVELAKFDFTGRFVDELQFQDADEFDYNACYRQVVASRLPGRGYTYWVLPGDLRRWIEFVICPFSDDDNNVNQCVALEDYEHLDFFERDSIEPSKKK